MWSYTSYMLVNVLFLHVQEEVLLLPLIEWRGIFSYIMQEKPFQRRRGKGGKLMVLLDFDFFIILERRNCGK